MGVYIYFCIAVVLSTNTPYTKQWHRPFLYPLSLQDLGQPVQTSQALGDVIIHVGVVNPHLGLRVREGRLREYGRD